MIRRNESERHASASSNPRRKPTQSRTSITVTPNHTHTRLDVPNICSTTLLPHAADENNQSRSRATIGGRLEFGGGEPNMKVFGGGGGRSYHSGASMHARETFRVFFLLLCFIFYLFNVFWCARVLCVGGCLRKPFCAYERIFVLEDDEESRVQHSTQMEPRSPSETARFPPSPFISFTLIIILPFE